MKVSRKYLYLFALILWLIGSYQVFSIAGSVTSTGSSKIIWLAISLSFFRGFIFPRAAKSNKVFIESLETDLNPWYKCQKVSSWLIMIFMIAFGISLRKSGWVSDNFVWGFYGGIAYSLASVAISIYGVAVWREIKLERIKIRERNND